MKRIKENSSFSIFSKVIFCLLWICLFACQSPKQEVPIVEEVIPEEKGEFPESWLGKWKGTLIITKPTGDTTQVAMQLHILENDSIDGWDWKIIYGEDIEKGTRAYSLLEKDVEQGHYIIDENNSILLDGFLFGDTFFSRFSVMDNLLLAIYRKTGNQITFEILSGGEKPIAITGEGEEDIPPVGSYGLSVHQRAVLTKL